MPGRESAVYRPQRSDSALTGGLRGLGTAALALPAVPTVASDRSPASVVLAVVAVVAGGVVAWWISRRIQEPALLFAALGALLVFAAGWLLPQADVALTTVLLGLGIGVGVGLGGGAVRRRSAVATAVVGAVAGIAALAVLVAVDGVHGTAWAGAARRRGDRRGGRAHPRTGAASAHSGARCGRRRSRPRCSRPAPPSGSGRTRIRRRWFGSQVGARPPRRARGGDHLRRRSRRPVHARDRARSSTSTARRARSSWWGRRSTRRPDIARGAARRRPSPRQPLVPPRLLALARSALPELERTQGAFRRKLGRLPDVLPGAARPAHAVHGPAWSVTTA